MTVVIVVLVALTTILVTVIGVPIFILLMIRNSVQASKYRESLKTAITIPKTGYQVVYTSGRKTSTLDVDGSTEGEAMQDLIKKGIRYDSIVSLTKK